ncbi:hypothetical protein LguiB_027184 [Lonicera macranthoides]
MSQELFSSLIFRKTGFSLCFLNEKRILHNIFNFCEPNSSQPLQFFIWVLHIHE